MATKNRTTKKGKVKFRFYIFCALFILIVVYCLKMATSLMFSKVKKPAKETGASVEQVSSMQTEEKENKNSITQQLSETAEKAAKEAVAEDVGYTEIKINFKDAKGNDIEMNIIPNCFITNIVEEVQWKKAVYQNLLNVETNKKENLNNTPSLTSFTGKNVTIKMNTAVEQYFRFVFVPMDKKSGYNPELHKELNIYFTSTPADDGVRVEYDAIVDYYAKMSDNVLELKLIKEEKIS